MEGELDIQAVALKVIERLQKQSLEYTRFSERLKWMAEGARELHEAIRQEAQRLSLPDTSDGPESVGESDVD